MVEYFRPNGSTQEGKIIPNAILFCLIVVLVSMIIDPYIGNCEFVVDEYIRPLHAVTLKIYDILGNEVITLVNEEKSPGNYEVRWDATEFSTGVYFYRLQAGEFISVKKLLLLK